MIAEIHTYGGKEDLFGGAEIRMSELLVGSKDELLKQVMMKKLSADMVGYTIYDLPDEATYLKVRTDYTFLQSVVVAQWFDKQAFHRGHSMRGPKIP